MYYFFNRYLSRKTVLLWVFEGLLIFSAILSVAAVRFGLDISVVMDYDPYLFKTILMTAVYLISLYIFDFYRPEYCRPGQQMILKLFQATMVSAVFLFSIYFLFPEVKTWRGISLGTVLAVPLLLIGWRKLLSRWPDAGLSEERVLIVGSGDFARKIGSDIYSQTGNGLRLVGFIDDDPAMLGKSIVNPGVIGGYGDIARLAGDKGISRIIVALPDRRAKLPMSALLDCKLKGVTIEEGETFKERISGKIPLDQLKPSWMVFSDGFKSLRSKKILKRLFDISFSVFLFVTLLPLMLLVALIIKLDSKGPAIFKQIRTGENGREFEIYKFRSMRQDAESATGPVWAKTEDDRVTMAGRIIRKLRIDELPQLINVIKGDMSFVGPRPERPYFVEKLKEAIPYYEVRAAVKPGITGWAQIKYPYGATFHDALEKLQYDIYYIKNMSLFLDWLIIFQTIRIVLTGKGAR